MGRVDRVDRVDRAGLADRAVPVGISRLAVVMWRKVLRELCAANPR
ncbi:hypothetical protein [Mycobacterium szulgai]|nr:hypothetical protein [Mycobacterium szulgai]